MVWISTWASSEDVLGVHIFLMNTTRLFSHYFCTVRGIYPRSPSRNEAQFRRHHSSNWTLRKHKRYFCIPTHHSFKVSLIVPSLLPSEAPSHYLCVKRSLWQTSGEWNLVIKPSPHLSVKSSLHNSSLSHSNYRDLTVSSCLQRRAWEIAHFQMLRVDWPQETCPTCLRTTEDRSKKCDTEGTL